MAIKPVRPHPSPSGDLSSVDSAILSAIADLKDQLSMKAEPLPGSDEAAEQVVSQSGEWRCIQCTHHWSLPAEDCECCQKPHCHQCGQPKCMCCTICQVYPCACEKTDDGSNQFRAYSPWEVRGQQIGLQITTMLSNWHQAWPALPTAQTTDVCRAAADFYLLDALRHGVVNAEHDCDGGLSGCGHIELLKLDEMRNAAMTYAAERYEELVRRLDVLFCQYVDMACGGELRHHPAVGDRTLSSHRRLAWSGWRVVREALGPNALLDMAELFRDWKGGGFGGELWAQAAERLYDRLTNRITPDQWIDRVFTLVHNGGVFLNKLNWGIENARHWDLGALQTKVLPAHASDAFNTLLTIASPEVVKLWDEYWVATNKARLRASMRPQPNPRVNPKFRWLCTSCHSDPTRGHLLACTRFRNNRLTTMALKDRAYKLFEDDWHAWNWDTWSQKQYPVSADGTISILRLEQYRFRVSVTRDLGIVVVYDRTLEGQHILTEQVKLNQFSFDSLKIWDEALAADGFPSHNPPYRYSVEMVCTHTGRTLMEWKSAPGTIEEIQARIIDFGLLLPHVFPEVKWSDVVDNFMLTVTEGKGQ